MQLPAGYRDDAAFDVIVAADCCYHDDGEAEGNEPFLATVTHLLRAGGFRFRLGLGRAMCLCASVSDTFKPNTFQNTHAHANRGGGPTGAVIT